MSSLSPECSGGPLRTCFLPSLIPSFRKPSRPAGSVMGVRDARVNMTAPTACRWSWLTHRRHGGHASVTFKPCSVAFFRQIVAEDASHTFQVQAARAITGPSPSASLPTGFDSSSVHINVQSSEQDVWGRMRSTDCNSPREAGFGSHWVEVTRLPPSLS